MSAPPSEHRSILRFAVVIAMATLVLLELGLRVFSRSDVDGNVWVGPLRVLPYRVPVEDVRARIAEYLDSGKSFLKYDPDLGWTIRPNGSSSDGLYHSNADGVRTGADRARAPLEPRPGVLRVAVFGDSFAFGADVGFEEAWPTVVGARLREGGRAVEVLNYGVGGYAIDQAYLRYRKQGRRYAPDIVVFAFQPSDV